MTARDHHPDMKNATKAVKLTVYLPEKTRTALRIRALQEGTTATALVQSLIQTYLAKPRRKGSR